MDLKELIAAVLGLAAKPEIVEIDGTGLSSANIGARKFQRVRRPVYPLDRGEFG